MRHPLIISKAGKLSKRPPPNKINFLVDGYVIGSAEFDDLVPGKMVQITPTATLTLPADLSIVFEPTNLVMQQRLVKRIGISI